MELNQPELPITHVYRVWSGPVWNRVYNWAEDVSDTWEDFFHDVEILDTFNDRNSWLVDTRGTLWNVRTHEYLWGKREETVFEVVEQTEKNVLRL